MSIRSSLRRLVPKPLLSSYHRALAALGAFLYRYPSAQLILIGVTGTNGKSSTTEFINAIFEEAGYRTALSNSIRTKVATTSHPSRGRSMPGRFFIQRLLRQAVSEGCTAAIVEMTSEGAVQHRHRGLSLDALVFLNLAPEHIESHGSLKAYADAKFLLGLSLASSSKHPRIMVANGDDAEGARYLALPVEKAIPFSLRDVQWGADEHGGNFSFGGTEIAVAFPGSFYIENALAAAKLAEAFGIDAAHIKKGIERVRTIPGRMERIDAGQPYDVIVDYALTPDALEALYKTFPAQKKICVFGSAGGGRDKWKRPVLGGIAERYCEKVILTNDIAYDEPPQRILEDIAKGMKGKKPDIVPDRRLAIRQALAEAASLGSGAVVLLTGMGGDTEVTGADGSVIPWDEAGVAREELEARKRL